MKKGQSPNAPGKKVDGLKKFSAEYGFSMEQIKAVMKTPDGAAAIGISHIVDPPKFCRAFVKFLNQVADGDLPKGITTWKEACEYQRAQILEVEKLEAKGKVMSRDEAKRQNGEAWAFSFDYWNRRLCNEGPPEHAGRNAIELFQRYTKLVEDWRKEAQDRFEKAA